MLLSICIPSYNRGALALKLVDELDNICKKYPNEIEIIVSNNGSNIGIKEYNMIKSKASDYLVYHEFDENKFFVGNYNQVIRMARGTWCLIISDEDHIIEENIDGYMKLLRDSNQLTLIRGCTLYQYGMLEGRNEFKTCGRDALEAYYLQGTYISGVFYNRLYLTNEIIDELEKKYLITSDNKAYFSYPHLFVEGLLMLSGDILILGSPIISEGDAEINNDKDTRVDIPFYASYEERIKQSEGHIDFINGLVCSEGIKLAMVLIVIRRTFFLVNLVKEAYINNGFLYADILYKVDDELKKQVLNIKISILSSALPDLYEYIDEVKNYYLNNIINN